MSFETNSPDFIAELKYRTAEEGGRTTPVFNSGYRPQVKFEFAELQTSGMQRFLNADIVYPGDSVLAELKLLSTDFLKGQLKEGMFFEFLEGSRIIGTGTIIRIQNDNLRIN